MAEISSEADAVFGFKDDVAFGTEEGELGYAVRSFFIFSLSSHLYHTVEKQEIPMTSRQPSGFQR